MSKQYRIRWKTEDTKELSRVVRNFNAKITRLSKSNPEIKNILPDKVSAKDVRELVNTRSDLKRELNALKRFSRKGAEDIVKAPSTKNDVYITKWQKEELTRRVAIVNRKRRARLSELDVLPAKSRGQELGYTVGQARQYIGMGRIRDVELMPMTAFTSSMTNREIKMRYESAKAQSVSDYFTKRDYDLKENYIKGILQNYNEEDVLDVINKIRNMDIKTFLEVFYEEGATFEFASPTGYAGSDNEAYSLKQFEYEGYVESLKSTWL